MPPTHQAGSDNRNWPVTPKEDAKPKALIFKPTVKGPPAIYVVGRAFLARKWEVQAFRECRWRSRYELRSATSAGRSVCNSSFCNSPVAPGERRNKARRAAQRVEGQVWHSFGEVHMRYAMRFHQCCLKSSGVLLCQFHSGVTNDGGKIKERGRAVPIDFDGNWPEMNLRPAIASLLEHKN